MGQLWLDVMDVVVGEDCAEGGRKGEEGGRREMKRKITDPGSSLLPKRRSTRVSSQLQTSIFLLHIITYFR